MIGVLETCECERKFLRGIYPQRKCEACDAWNDDYWGKHDPVPDDWDKKSNTVDREEK